MSGDSTAACPVAPTVVGMGAAAAGSAPPARARTAIAAEASR
ncbi:MAG TPA: hypothetical protein VFW65_05500 [Pseudonocardiaceae bacterium]|nr:hypothetical protein [Pseudonocardiaceae bacterium]